MKQIENIFSSSKTKNDDICPNPKNPITIDTREKNSMISANLIQQKAQIKFEKLEIGDYIIKEICIERKTFSDFISSIIDKRLFNQLTELKKYENHLLILEGFDYNYSKFKIHENAIRGMITSVATEFKVPIIYTCDELDTSKFLINLAKKKEKENSQNPLRESKKLKSIQEQKEFILEGFPEIGPSASKKLLENNESLMGIFNYSKEKLQELGLKENQIESFLKILKS